MKGNSNLLDTGMTIRYIVQLLNEMNREYEVRKKEDITAILNGIKKILNDCRVIIKDYNFEDGRYKGESRQDFITIIEMKIERLFKERFGIDNKEGEKW